MAPVWIAHTDEELGVTVNGNVALYREYRGADPGTLRIRIALAGRLLCEWKMAHPFRGLAHLDCSGLKPNRDWI